eukprot:CAMPEP_0197532906 /NCGR_PEP_ID=MMETSP1318-20131121/41382_1 /TAXON_ID=552666 /ORGANISM="Partenskyella glossopodia, Strain RCC365" /LENGTH=395 /DNA_ID=CAMNT_0043089605 /DNA_START=143 /DNA_END=1330 /DNA_ORIENTATION=+
MNASKPRLASLVATCACLCLLFLSAFASISSQPAGRHARRLGLDVGQMMGQQRDSPVPSSSTTSAHRKQHLIINEPQILPLLLQSARKSVCKCCCQPGKAVVAGGSGEVGSSSSSSGSSTSSSTTTGSPPVQDVESVPDDSIDRGSVSAMMSSLSLDALKEAAAMEDPNFIMLGEDANYGDLSIVQIEKNIQDRRNRIFQLMEEVRRLRIQQRIKAKVTGLSGTQTVREMQDQEKFPSALPYFPPITKDTINDYFNVYSIFVPGTIIFGGLVAPLLEVKMGLGGASYADFIASIGLPHQLAAVDPIVASFCGGVVGVLSALLAVEVNNAKAQAARVCTFCEGGGYLVCGMCGGNGLDSGEVCKTCGGLGKVMCTSCAATGKKVFSEHDPRIDPFN